MTTLVIFCLIGACGIGAQWIAWRWKIPAIVVMLVVGVLIGPTTGILQPQAVFGDLLEPLIATAVALILFEGGLTLHFARLADAETAVRRLVIIGGPLVWGLATLCGHYIGGLSWASSAVLGGILIVTGPTVIIPLLRQASLKRRPAEILRWEAIVNDPVGALAAVLAFELTIVAYSAHSLSITLGHMALGIVLSIGIGYLGAWLLILALRKGHIPEYLKVPVMIVAVLIIYTLPNSLLHESGLLAVTVMGMVLGNSSVASLDEIRRFKENITVLLVSAVFILLAADVDLATLTSLGWREIVFVLMVLFVVRPLAVFLSLIGTGLPLSEKLIVGWIGPRGVVAVAIAGLFGNRLVELGVEDAAILPPLAFAIVAVTVVFHGFSLEPLSRHFQLKSTATKGLLIVGANPFSRKLAETIQSTGRPVMIADRNWKRIRSVRGHDIPCYFGEILSEEAELDIEMNQFDSVVALTDNDDYNALVCVNYGPEFGRHRVFQFTPSRSGNIGDSAHKAPETLGGYYFGNNLDYDTAIEHINAGWCLRLTRLSKEYTFDDYRHDNPEARVISAYSENGSVRVMTRDTRFEADSDETLLALVPDDTSEDKARRHAARKGEKPPANTDSTQADT